MGQKRPNNERLRFLEGENARLKKENLRLRKILARFDNALAGDEDIQIDDDMEVKVDDKPKKCPICYENSIVKFEVSDFQDRKHVVTRCSKCGHRIKEGV